MKRIGYARVSTQGQNLARQIAALEAVPCDRIFTDKASGTTTRKRPGLEKALGALGAGDVLVVAEWDRVTRSMMDGLALITRIHEAGAKLKVLDRASLDLTTPVGRAVIGLLSAIYEEERERIVSRAAQGRTEAKKRGVKFGRKVSLRGSELATALELASAGDSARAIGRKIGRHHSTVSAALKRTRRKVA